MDVNAADISEVTARLRALLTGPISALGLDLEGVEVSSAGKRRVLRIAVDKDGGVTMDDVADATRAVSQAVDSDGAVDAMGDRPYTLEVSSPGVDRPLTLPRHWRRNLDRLVKVTPRDGEPLIGRVVEAREESVVLDVEGERRDVALSDVRRALVQVEFKPRDRGGE